MTTVRPRMRIETIEPLKRLIERMYRYHETNVPYCSAQRVKVFHSQPPRGMSKRLPTNGYPAGPGGREGRFRNIILKRNNVDARMKSNACSVITTEGLRWALNEELLYWTRVKGREHI